MSPTSRTVDAGGVRIHFLDTGDDGTGRPPIVFAPGVTDIALDYESVLDDLGRRAVVVDFRGRGLSETPPAGYSMEGHIADLSAVVGEVTEGPVHLMSFSRGTCYAIGWAIENAGRVLSFSIGDYPGRVIEFPEDIVTRFMAGTWRGTPVAERVSEVALSGVVREAVPREFWGDLATFDVPFLIVRAGKDSFIDDDDWKRYARLADVRTVTFEDSPHDLFRPDRTRYPRLVRAQVDAADAKRSAPKT